MSPNPDRRRTVVPLERLSVPDVLSCTDPFTAARPEEIAELSTAAVRLRKPGRTELLAAGAVPEGFFVVLRGRVNLVKRGADDRDLILTTLGPGDVFGESCAFGEQPMSVSAVSATPVDLLRIPADVVRAHVRRSPETLLRVSQVLHQRLQEIEAVASSLALCDVEQRLRQTLTRLVRRQGRKAAAEPGWILAPVPTQSELARMVGSCRETVSRTLSAMARSGLVESRGRRMILSDELVAS